MITHAAFGPIRKIHALAAARSFADQGHFSSTSTFATIEISMKVLSLFLSGAFCLGWLPVALACNQHDHDPSHDLEHHRNLKANRNPKAFFHDDYDDFDPSLDVEHHRNLQVNDPEDFYHDDYDECLSTPTEHDMAQGMLTDEFASRRRRLSASPIRIPVVIHRIRFTPERPLGATDEMITNQMDVLNAAYAPHFSFDLVNQTETFNENWFRYISIDRFDLINEMKAALHQGGPDTLNIYINLPRFGGIATFPWNVETEPILDGIVVSVKQMPGGRSKRFNEGKTTVHEVGHWLGLFHTFEVRIVGDTGSYIWCHYFFYILSLFHLPLRPLPLSVSLAHRAVAPNPTTWSPILMRRLRLRKVVRHLGTVVI